LRILVSISEIGSVIDILTYSSLSIQRPAPALPAGLSHARQFPCQGQFPEANSAKPESSQKSPRPPAATAAAVSPNCELGSTLLLLYQTLLRHNYSSLRNGIPNSRSSCTHSASVLAVVVMAIDMPRTLSILS
jgi:hypothetical protein